MKVMVTNSINNANIQLSFEIIEHVRNHNISPNPHPGLGQQHKCGRVKPTNSNGGITTLLLIIGSPKEMQIKN